MDPDSDRDDRETTERFKQQQAERESDEDRLFAGSGRPAEAKQHERRRDKAAYLKEKLAERQRAEREAEPGD